MLTTLRLRLLAVAGAGVALAGLLGWLMARRIVQPVVRLRDTAESIATTQDLTTPIPTEGTGEVDLARSFTTMVGRAGHLATRAAAAARQRRPPADAHAAHEPAHEPRAAGARGDQLPASERAELLEAVQVDVG